MKKTIHMKYKSFFFFFFFFFRKKKKKKRCQIFVICEFGQLMLSLLDQKIFSRWHSKNIFISPPPPPRPPPPPPPPKKKLGPEISWNCRQFAWSVNTQFLGRIRKLSICHFLNFAQPGLNVNPKSANHNCSRQNFYFHFLQQNKTCNFMWIVCYNSHEIPSPFFLKNKTEK